jgi:RNA polymerase sigma-70 factor (ECF subfamily)
MIDSVPVPAVAPDIQDLYRAHVRGLYAFVYARVGNREAAEDITGDIFVKALAHLDLTRTEHSLVAWLYRVARTAVADYWRQDHGSQMLPLDAELADSIQPPAAPDVARQTDTAAQARALLDGLPENYRRVLSYRLLDGVTVAETARLMNLSEGNVRVLQHRALTRAAQLHGGDPLLPRRSSDAAIDGGGSN